MRRDISRDARDTRDQSRRAADPDRGHRKDSQYAGAPLPGAIRKRATLVDIRPPLRCRRRTTRTVEVSPRQPSQCRATEVAATERHRAGYPRTELLRHERAFPG